MNKTAWLSRTLIVCAYHYCLSLSEKQMYAACKKSGLPVSEWPHVWAKKNGATCHFYDEEKLCFVGIRDTADHTLEQIYSLLAHEAVHIWQKHKEAMGEFEPGREIEAYSIQAITHELMTSFRAQGGQYKE